MESPGQELFRMTQGYKTAQALYVAAKLGVADHLQHGPERSEEIAKEVGANPKALFRLMRHLAAIEIFTQDESGKFGPTPLGECKNTRPSQLDLTMMIMTSGVEESEWKRLLRSAGFALTRVYKKESQLDFIEAKPDK
jgi:Dimerisation domain